MTSTAKAASANLAKRVIPPLLLAAGVVIFVIAFVVSDTDDSPDVVVSGNPNIERLIPAPGSEVLRQSQVGIDLVAGFEAELEINGVAIPPDQVNILRSAEDPEQSADQAGTFDTTLSQFLYQPLEGREVPELKADTNKVVARFWPSSDPTNVDMVEWSFTVN